MTALLYGAIVFCCGYIGFLVSSSYRAKYRYFYELNMLIEKLNVDIGYFQTKLSDVLSSFKSSEIKSTILAYVKFLESDGTVSLERVLKSVEIPDKERSSVVSFFSALGGADVEEQKKMLASYATIFRQAENYRKQDYEKKGKMYFKLSIFLGIGIVILLL